MLGHQYNITGKTEQTVLWDGGRISRYTIHLDLAAGDCSIEMYREEGTLMDSSVGLQIVECFKLWLRVVGCRI